MRINASGIPIIMAVYIVYLVAMALAMRHWNSAKGFSVNNVPPDWITSILAAHILASAITSCFFLFAWLFMIRFPIQSVLWYLYAMLGPIAFGIAEVAGPFFVLIGVPVAMVGLVSGKLRAPHLSLMTASIVLSASNVLLTQLFAE